MLQDRRGAQTWRTVGLFGVDAVVGLEPDLLTVDEADDRDRHPEDARGDAGHAVEGAVGPLVEDPVTADGGKPPLLVRPRRARSVEETVAPPGTRVRAILANIPLHAYGCLHLPLPPKQGHRVKKVLLVDDESNMRFVLRMILESEGYEVVVAQHGAAALETLRRSGADLVLTDLMMPVMSGRELVERLRADQETAEIPIVVVTATHELVLPDADAVIAKPFDEEELLAVVRSLTEKESV